MDSTYINTTFSPRAKSILIQFLSESFSCQGSDTEDEEGGGVYTTATTTPHYSQHQQKKDACFLGRNQYGLILLPEHMRFMCSCGTAVVDGVILAYQVSDLIDIVLQCDLNSAASKIRTGDILLKLFRKSTFCLPRSQHAGNINGVSDCTIHEYPVYNFLGYLLKSRTVLDENIVDYNYHVLHALAQIANASASGAAAIQVLHAGCASFVAVYMEVYVRAKYTRSKPHVRVDNLPHTNSFPVHDFPSSQIVEEGRLLLHPLRIRYQYKEEEHPNQQPQLLLQQAWPYVAPIQITPSYTFLKEDINITTINTKKSSNNKCIGFFYHNRLAYSLCFVNNTMGRLWEMFIAGRQSSVDAATLLLKASSCFRVRYPTAILSLFLRRTYLHLYISEIEQRRTAVRLERDTSSAHDSSYQAVDFFAVCANAYFNSIATEQTKSTHCGVSTTKIGNTNSNDDGSDGITNYTYTSSSTSKMHVTNLWSYILVKTAENQILTWSMIRRLLEFLLTEPPVHDTSSSSRACFDRAKRFELLMCICDRTYCIKEELPITSLVHFESLQNKYISIWRADKKKKTKLNDQAKLDGADWASALDLLENIWAKEQYARSLQDSSSSSVGPNVDKFVHLPQCVAMLRAERRAVQLLKYLDWVLRVPRLVHQVIDAFDKLVGHRGGYGSANLFANRS